MVSLLQNIYNESIGFTIPAKKESDISGSPVCSCNAKLKDLVWKLKNFFLIDAYSEAFMEYAGIKVLLSCVEVTSGNTSVNIIINFKKNFLLYF